MKKKIIGIAAAALLLGSSIGYAANSSLIGAKVTGLFTVEQNGKKIADAIIINGSAYVPVRAMSEATGTGLAVEGKKITMESKAAATAEPDNTALLKQLSEKQTTVARNETQIANLNNIQASGYADEATSPSYKYELTESYAKTTAEIKRLETETEQLRADIKELQAQLGE